MSSARTASTAHGAVEDKAGVRPQWSTLGALVPGALVGLFFIVQSSWSFEGQRRFTLFDDAMVSMTYGRTLADGHGLVWFPGAPRVEGFTNPLWTLVMALLHALGLGASQVSLAIMLIGLVCVLGSALVCARLVRQLTPEARWAPPVATFCVALCYPLLFWSLRGMEVGFLLLVALALLSSTVALADLLHQAEGVYAGRRTLGLIAFLLIVGLATRLDFVVVALIVLLWIAWVAPPGRRRQTVVPIAGVLVGTVAVMTAARLAYYGHAVPNTFTLKVAGIPLLDRLTRGFITDLKLAPLLVMILLATTFLARTGERRLHRAVLLLASVGVGVVAYSTFVGGDAWEFMPNRYVIPLIPITVVLTCTALERAVERSVRPSRRQYLLAGAVVVISSVGLSVSRIVFEGHFTLARYVYPALLVVAVAVTGLLVGVAWLALSRGDHGRGNVVVVAACLCLLLFSSSAFWTVDWIRGGPFDVAQDQLQTERGLLLGAITAPGAVIATSYAGAPIYYSRRDGLDLLGKSDAVVAAVAPRGDFFPGHNKWDYGYSILEREPDVVTEFARAPDVQEQRQIDRLYRRVCLIGVSGDGSIYVRRNSTKVMLDPALVGPCASEEGAASSSTP